MQQMYAAILICMEADLSWQGTIVSVFSALHPASLEHDHDGVFRMIEY